MPSRFCNGLCQLPSICFRKLNGEEYFTRIDLSKGYWQISIPEEDIPKTAFVTTDRSYEFLKMLFGMINSAVTLKRAMKKLLHGLDNFEFYWDDILVHTCAWEEHIKALRELFRQFLAAGMTIRPTKCRAMASYSPFGMEARNCQAQSVIITQPSRKNV